jgi:hypothetical protein
VGFQSLQSRVGAGFVLAREISIHSFAGVVMDHGRSEPAIGPAFAQPSAASRSLHRPCCARREGHYQTHGSASTLT